MNRQNQSKKKNSTGILLNSCRVWISHKIVRNYSFPTSLWYNNAFALRHRMLHFIQNLLYYITVEVLEPSWQVFVEKIRKVDNVDQVCFYYFTLRRNSKVQHISGHLNSYGTSEHLHERVYVNRPCSSANSNQAD